MKRNLLIIYALLGLMFSGALATSAWAMPVTFSFTADNRVSSWWVISTTPVSVDLGSDSRLRDWQVLKSYTLELPEGQYQLVWQTINDDYALFRSPSDINPGGFLAEIGSSPWIIFSQGSFVSSATWEAAIVYGEVTPQGDFNSLSWSPALEYGVNGGSNIWTAVHSGAIGGISSDARWIWGARNFGDPDAPGIGDSIYFRVQFEVIPAESQHAPEPTSLALLGTGIVPLAIAARRRCRKQVTREKEAADL